MIQVFAPDLVGVEGFAAEAAVRLLRVVSLADYVALNFSRGWRVCLVNRPPQFLMLLCTRLSHLLADGHEGWFDRLILLMLQLLVLDCERLSRGVMRHGRGLLRRTLRVVFVENEKFVALADPLNLVLCR